MSVTPIPDWLREQIKKDNLMRLGKQLMVEEEAICSIRRSMFALKKRGRENSFKYKIYQEKMKPHEEQIEKIRKESEIYHSL